MNTQELIEKVTEDGEMFVLECRKFKGDCITYYIDHIYIKDDICFELTLFCNYNNSKWAHYTDAPLTHITGIPKRDFATYEPINIEKFIEQNFAELL